MTTVVFTYLLNNETVHCIMLNTAVDASDTEMSKTGSYCEELRVS